MISAFTLVFSLGIIGIGIFFTTKDTNGVIMGCGFIGIGLLMFILTIIGLVRKYNTNTFAGRQDPPLFLRSQNTKINPQYLHSVIFDQQSRMAYYYHAALDLTKKSQITQNADYEILPAMLSLLDLCAFETNRDRTQTLYDFKSMIRNNCRQFTTQESESFNQRLDLYSEIIQGKSARGEWHFGNLTKQQEDDFIVRVCSALGDILINPECADDYDNAPIMLHDIRFVMLFTQDTMLPLIKLFARMFAEFREQKQFYK